MSGISFQETSIFAIPQHFIVPKSDFRQKARMIQTLVMKIKQRAESSEKSIMINEELKIFPIKNLFLNYGMKLEVPKGLLIIGILNLRVIESFFYVHTSRMSHGVKKYQNIKSKMLLRT